MSLLGPDIDFQTLLLMTQVACQSEEGSACFMDGFSAILDGLRNQLWKEVLCHKFHIYSLQSYVVDFEHILYVIHVSALLTHVSLSRTNCIRFLLPFSICCNQNIKFFKVILRTVFLSFL